MTKLRRAAVLGIAALALPLTGSDHGEAYRLTSSHAEARVALRADARFWHPDKWAPGQELVFHVVDDPLWYERFDSSAELLAWVEGALAFWRNIPGTDIRWSVAADLLPDRPSDGRSFIHVVPGGSTQAGVVVRLPNPGPSGPDNRGVASRCRVQLGIESILTLADRDRDDRAERDGGFIHELGHCLGIHHADDAPFGLDTLRTTASLWGEDARMSYGVHLGVPLLPDDIVAARLMRPAAGYLETTGSIAGRLTLDGAAAPFVVVEALRREGRVLRPAAHVFSNELGEFVVEALAPGTYFLWIRPLSNASANGDLARSAPADIDDLVSFNPIAVSAGAVSSGHDFALSRGRRVR